MRFLDLRAGLVIGAALAVAGSAAGDEVSAQARALYERGMAHFQLAEYDDAIQKWQEGFRLKPVPEFLYNIGQAYRLSNRPEKAVQAYKAYLRMAPEAPNRAEVDRHVAALQAAIDQQRRTATATPTPPREPKSVAPETAPATSGPATERPSPAATASGEAAGNQLTATAPARPKPITKRAWFWGVVAGGAVVVAGAVVVGVVLGTRDNTRVLGDLTY
jgi:tetratricopeptide (TPR) repeat protein